MANNGTHSRSASNLQVSAGLIVRRRLKWNAAQCHNSILPFEKVIGTRSRSSTGANVCLSSRLVTLVRQYLMSEVFSRSRFDRPMKYYSEMFPHSDGSHVSIWQPATLQGTGSTDLSVKCLVIPFKQANP